MGHLTHKNEPLDQYTGFPASPILQALWLIGAEKKEISSSPHLGERYEKVRRTIFLLAAVGTALLLSSGVALALNIIKCESEEPCHGTDRPDLMKGTDGFNFMLVATTMTP